MVLRGFRAIFMGKTMINRYQPSVFLVLPGWELPPIETHMDSSRCPLQNADRTTRKWLGKCVAVASFGMMGIHVDHSVFFGDGELPSGNLT